MPSSLGDYDTLSGFTKYIQSIVMSLDLMDVRRIATLARIEVDGDELGRLQGELNGILAFVERLQAVDTRGIAPMAHAVEVSQRLRVDVVTETDRRDDYRAIAPETEAGLFLVPKVIE